MKNKFHPKIVYVFVLFLSTYVSVSHAKPQCEKLFQNQNAIQKIGNLFLKDPISNFLPTKYWGFATSILHEDAKRNVFENANYYVFDFIPNKLGHLITLDQNYRFTPFKALDENLLQKPTRYTSEKIIRKKKELGILIKLPLIALLSITAWKNFDEHIFMPEVEARISEQIAAHIQKNSSYYDKLIDSDYRFKYIKESKANSTDARFQAFGLKKSYENYIKTYMETAPKDLSLQENIEKFGSHPLFSHLNFFFENGVRQYPGTYVPSQYQGPLSDEQKKKLFDLTHLLYAKYLAIDLLFDNKTDQKKLIRSNMLVRDIFEDEYSQKLILQYKKKKISKEELIYYMQEDAHHAYYMALFESLHIVNLKSESNLGQPDPLTLSDLRNSRLSSLH